jgi:hypothetical protein
VSAYLIFFSFFAVRKESAMAEQKKNIKWRASEARKILIKDLESGVLPVDNKDCSEEEAWERYKGMLAFLHVPYKQFCKQLAAHREQAKRIDWKNSDARKILIKDLQKGSLPLYDHEMSAETAWETRYKMRAEFQDVPFSQFKERLADHRAQVEKDRQAAVRNAAALINSRAIYPRAEYNHKGEKVFDMSPAKQLLRRDIKAGLLHPEYLEFKKPIFHNHVRQEKRRRRRVDSKKEDN